MSKENPEPKIHRIGELFSKEEKDQRLQKEQNEDLDDEIDIFEVFEIIRHINDPEHPLTLEQLNVVTTNQIEINKNEIKVFFTPTIFHCSMAQTIGLFLKVKLLRSLPKKMKIDVFIFPGSHAQENQINKQINDKERIAAALENQNVLNLLKQGTMNTDKAPKLYKPQQQKENQQELLKRKQNKNKESGFSKKVKPSLSSNQLNLSFNKNNI